MSGYLEPAQVDILLRPIKPNRVAVLDGMSHVEAYEIRAHLNRCFGFARWSEELVELVELFALPTETKNKKPAVNVAYRATVRLTVCSPDGAVLATYTEAAVGGSIMPDFKRADAYDMAVKTAESQALKRCAANLGDQFGLSLYRNGSTDAVVVDTLVGKPSAKDDKPGRSVDEKAPDVVPEAQPGDTPATSGTDEPDPMERLLTLSEMASNKDALNAVWQDGRAAHDGGHITTAEWEDIKTLLGARFRDLEKEKAS